MTDRINSFIVVLDKDYRDDDVEVTLQAIGRIKGVIHVQGNISDVVADIVAETRVKNEVRSKLFKVIEEI